MQELAHPGGISVRNNNGSKTYEVVVISALSQKKRKFKRKNILLQ
jgi:hypothetical protein